MDIFQKIAYADCFSGISGDMFLGALLDAGFPEQALAETVASLCLQGVDCVVSRELHQGLRATRVRVAASARQPHRRLRDIAEILEQSTLAQAVKQRSLAVFTRLAEAEAKVHGCAVEEVHFHEVGAADAIVDIVGVVAALDYFSINRLISSPLPMARGWVKAAHGDLPLPAPAVCELVRALPVYGVDLAQELVTPTGAALLATCASGFGPMPAMVMEKTAYSCGTMVRRDGRPNLFRLFIGSARSCDEAQEVEVIETHLDDWSPEGFPYLCEQMFLAGALDVSLTPIQMKKGRPGFLLRVLAAPAQSWPVKQKILSETTAIGLRFHTENRVTLPRETGSVNTRLGNIRVKKVESPAGPVLYPEYEECRRLAETTKKPLGEVYAAVDRYAVDTFIPDPEK